MRGRRRRRLALAGGAVLVASLTIGVPVRYWRGVPPWALEGFAMTFCPCGTPCPCRSGGRPIHDRCEAATFVHVVRGHFGAVALDGLRFVTLSDMHAGRWLVVYADASLSSEVRDAMLGVAEDILMPRRFFAPLFARAYQPRLMLRSVERVDYEVLEDGLRRRVRVPGILELDGRLRVDDRGHPRQVVPALDMVSNWIAYADNLAYRYDDPALGLTFDYGGRQANMKTFRVSKEDYDARRLLIQDAPAMHGGWSERQLVLIAALRASGELRPDRLVY
jgi:hypothetical protein